MTSTSTSPSSLLGDTSNGYFNFNASSVQQPTQKQEMSQFTYPPNPSNDTNTQSTNFQLFKQNLFNARAKKQQQLNIPKIRIAPVSDGIDAIKLRDTPSEEANLENKPQVNPLGMNSFYQSSKFFDASTFNIQPIHDLEEFEHILHLSPSEEIAIIDLRPFNQYNMSRISDSLSICIPSTLLKRNSFNLSNIFRTMIGAQEHILKSKLTSSNPLKIIFYDTSSVIDHCSLQVYQIIKKFEEKLTDYNKPISLYIINQGYTLFTKDKELGSKYTDQKRFKPVKSPDQACFSEFLLPSADPTSSFLMSLKSNQMIVNNSDKTIDSKINLPSLSHTEMEKLPTWLKPFSKDDCIGSVVSKFNKIENSENQRLSASVSLYRRKSSSGRIGTESFNCSPVSPNAGSYHLIGPENGFKNRYPNILPYEHSRVKLVPSPLPSASSVSSNTFSNSKMDSFFFPPTPNLSITATTPTHGTNSNVHSDSSPSPILSAVTANTASTSRKPSLSNALDDYFNANFISVPQINSNSHYIATQAPLPSTIDDFWKVVWYNNSDVIVSLTNLDEYGMKKSDIYWHDSAHVKLLEETKNFSGLEGLIVRKIQLMKRNKAKVVHQLHFMNWPDYGTADPSNILKLMEIKDSFVKDKSNPIVVHCSAGCGRTGTFIAIDVILEAFKNNFLHDKPETAQNDIIKDPTTIDIWQTKEDLINLTVQQIRKQRILMVQSLKQFILCYETILFYFSKYGQ